MKQIELAIIAALLSMLPQGSEVAGAKYGSVDRAGANAASGPATITIVSQNAGPTPFISDLQLMASNPSAVKSIKFSIAPKSGSVTRPISATYTAAYLQNRGYFNLQTGAITLPVFGLYAGYSNQVTLNCSFSDNSTQQLTATVSTAAFSETCGYSSPMITQARTSDTSLSYDFMLLKVSCGTQSPAIIDTDGVVRWVGTAGVSAFGSMFFDNGFYISSPPPNSSTPTGITRMEFDGTYTFLKDYSNIGVTNSGHHNYDPAKRGMLLTVNTTAYTESTVLEVDASGNLLQTWNLAQIISAAMTAGGDDPSQFVQPAPNDWFHNNANTYRASDDSLIVSSRENFVIALDYSTGAIKWILGDPTKQWYQFPSLRKYALTVGPNSLPPIGQHAISITYDDDLLLFDNGTASLDHTPAGASRSYSAPRKYHIDTVNKIATEVWNYPNGESIYSNFCGSVYEDQPLNYLIDYANATPSAPILIGLNSSGNKVFEYQYKNGCGVAWNAIPIHLEQLVFTSPPLIGAVSTMSHGSAGTFDINLPLAGTPGIECRSSESLGSGNYVLVFTFVNNLTSVGAANITSGNGSIRSSAIGPNPNQYTVNLTGVTNAQYITVTLTSVVDSKNNTGGTSVPMGVLLADVNGSGRVDTADISLVRQQTLQPVTGSTFRNDINASGRIDAADLSIVRQQTLTSLP